MSEIKYFDYSSNFINTLEEEEEKQDMALNFTSSGEIITKEMKDKNPKKNINPPLLRGRFSSGGVLQNVVIPPYLNHLLNGLRNMICRNPEGVKDVHSTLWTLFDFLALFIIVRARNRIYQNLMKCDELYSDWAKKRFTMFPEDLANLLHRTAQDFLYHYHTAGLGIEYEKYESREKQIKSALGL